MNITATILEMIEQKDFESISALFAEINIIDLAEALSELPEKDSIKLFRMLKKDTAVEVFAYLDSEVQKAIIEAISDKDINGIIDDMFLDDVVDLIEEMPANVVRRVLQIVPEQKRKLINQFLQYPEDSVGSIMTIEYVSLKEDYTVREAFEGIRATGVDKETVYDCYVTRADRVLTGTISVKTLLLSRFEDKIGDIMETNPMFAYTTDDQETIATAFRKYGLLAMPVVDMEQRLVGIVTVDDIVQIIEEENTEDFEKMAALNPSDEPYLKTGVWKLAKNRFGWLLVLMLSATITGAIISSFEDALAVLPVLVASIPMLMDTGGNAGSQTATLIIRGMALQEIHMSDILKVLWKELRVSILCGIALAIVNFVRIYLMNEGDVLLALTVSISLLFTVVIAKCTGCLLPIAAKRVKLDPAIMASPLITTIVDAASLFIYFALATAILHI